MIETERGTFVRRVVNFALGRGFQGGRNGSAAAGESAAQQTLMWLAGAGYRPRKETATLRPASRHERELADRLLSAERPADPVEAAAKRSELLTGLREGAREDARVIALFEDDPVVIEDPVSHRIVTESILSARYSHFDALNALFGASPLGEPARQALRTALTDAFPLLSPAAQQEWALSEFRLAQTLGFLQRREEGEILALAAELRPVFEMRGGWETGRLLSHAAALGSPEAGRRLPVGDLLEPDPARAEL